MAVLTKMSKIFAPSALIQHLSWINKFSTILPYTSNISVVENANLAVTSCVRIYLTAIQFIENCSLAQLKVSIPHLYLKNSSFAVFLTYQCCKIYISFRRRLNTLSQSEIKECYLCD